MKRYIYAVLIAAAAMVVLSSCKEEVGVDPGNDAGPMVTLYTLEPSADYDPDTTSALRIVPNNKVQSIYMLAELLADKQAYIAANGAKAYMAYVVENGKKYEVEGDLEVTSSDLKGLYAITVVAQAANGVQAVAETQYKGIIWLDAGKAYVWQNLAGDDAGAFDGEVVVQRQSDNNIFRVVDMFYQLEPSLGNSIPSKLFFEFDEKQEFVSFDSDQAPFVIINQKKADGTYHGYYDTAQFAQYCSIGSGTDSDGDYALVNLLLLNNNTGSLSPGGAIYFYTNDLIWLE